jgi:hypothetical protein
MGLDIKTYWLTDRQSQCDCDFDFVDGVGWGEWVESLVEAGSNTSTVALRVVGGDEKGSLQSEKVKYGRESHGMIALATASRNSNRQTRPLVRESAPYEQTRDCQ